MYLKHFWKHGENQRMWLNKLKVAIVQKDMQLLESLLSDIPELDDMVEIENAIYLLKKATVLVESLKDEAAVSMQQLKKNIDFLNSTRAGSKNILDISS